MTNLLQFYRTHVKRILGTETGVRTDTADYGSPLTHVLWMLDVCSKQKNHGL